jgi:hypothetical protein
MGVAPEQFAADIHWTHVFVPVSQAEVAPVHLVALVAVHWTQAPVAAQAVRAGLFKAEHSVSAAHARHFSAVPQIGVEPEQFDGEVHCTQVLVLVSQTEIAPVHEALDVAVHCTHWPSVRHAGRTAFLA